jgi:hypothetical protein
MGIAALSLETFLVGAIIGERAVHNKTKTNSRAGLHCQTFGRTNPSSGCRL